MLDAHPYRDQPTSSSKWYRIKGSGGFLINLEDVYICKWDRENGRPCLIISFKHGSWSWDGFRHTCIKIYGDDANDLERALLTMGTK